MLYDLQSYKVNKIILCPIINEIKKSYITSGFSIEFLMNIFTGVSITKRVVEKQNKYSMSLTIKDYYICRGLMLNNRLNGYPYDEEGQEKEKEIFKKIEDFYRNDPKIASKNRYEFEFEEILSIVSEDDLLCSLKWFEKQVKFAIQLLEKYENSSIVRKKKVSSILEEL